MAKTLRGHPAPGLDVRDPDRGNIHVPREEADYPATDYWLRRFRSGDMVAASPAVASAPAEKASKPAKA